jgi:hypothetical protein
MFRTAGVWWSRGQRQDSGGNHTSGDVPVPHAIGCTAGYNQQYMYDNVRSHRPAEHAHPLDTVPCDICGLLACFIRHVRTITDKGFQFLLQDSHRQLWIFLTHYIRDTAQQSHGKGTGKGARRCVGGG